MFERELKLYAYNLGYCKRLASDIEEAKLVVQPAPTLNPPLWILGHLAIATDWAMMNLGQKPSLPKDWHKAFGMNSTPLALPVRPTKDELLAAIEAGHARVTAAVPLATPDLLDKPHPVESMRNTPIETVGDLLAHLLTTHGAFHIGQLSYWRRQMGFAPFI